MILAEQARTGMKQVYLVGSDQGFILLAIFYLFGFTVRDFASKLSSTEYSSR